MLIAKLEMYTLVILILGPDALWQTVALTMGRWHHLLVIVWCAIDTSGFRRRHNLIIRVHLQSNHEPHYEENASKTGDATDLFLTSLILAKMEKRGIDVWANFFFFFNIMSSLRILNFCKYSKWQAIKQLFHIYDFILQMHCIRVK